jgi:hypothetical protein
VVRKAVTRETKSINNSMTAIASMKQRLEQGNISKAEALEVLANLARSREKRERLDAERVTALSTFVEENSVKNSSTADILVD